jgi:hypothetical protein
MVTKIGNKIFLSSRYVLNLVYGTSEMQLLCSCFLSLYFFNKENNLFFIYTIL